MTLRGSFPSFIPGPPPPPPHIRVNKKDVLITKSSINFTFNCSWFSDTNGAVKYFTVVVREADGKWSWIHSTKTQDCFLKGPCGGPICDKFLRVENIFYIIFSTSVIYREIKHTKKKKKNRKKLFKGSFSRKTYYLLGLIIKWMNNNNSNHNNVNNNYHLLSPYYVPGTAGSVLRV